MKGYRAGEVAAGLALDALLGEPPEAVHPTVWMGRVISAVEKRAIAVDGPYARRLIGACLAVFLPATVFLIARAVLDACPRRLRWTAEAILLSTTFSMRGLARAARAVEHELAGGDLEAARGRVGELVGRDTAHLSPAEVARAAVESVAENASDGVVAPMLYGALFGAPGALAYKAVNTLDSMVGYRAGRYAELGWASARLDDLANFLPARVTALCVAAVSGPAALRSARRYGPLTSSPNAGRAEAAFAGALGLRLGGTNTYRGEVHPGPILGDGDPPDVEDIRRAVALMRRSCAFFLAVLLALARRG